MFAPGSKRFLLKLTIILLATLAISSLLYRWSNAKPLLQPEFADSRFNATWCSGRSDRSILAQLIGARMLLWIIVTKDHLHVSPHFPFNLMFLPEAFGWDHRIPGKTIMDVRQIAFDSGQSGVLIRYRHATGDEERLELQTNDIPGLMQALAEIRRR
jgi:hypothetical protein